MGEPINHFSDLIVYRKAFALGLRIFELSRSWPVEERYALIDQIRRSSRSVGANIAEAWAKRRYAAHFVSKLSDSDAELHETEHWLRCALKHGYLVRGDFDLLSVELTEVGKMLGSMMYKPDSFLLRPRRPQSASTL
ncbi:MAG TPA: four helix bundle protein [Opitutaceae bacterium]|jgi:four helix bundle protein|nr:four helix bundle protein [Opitutaceae bacterium]